MADDPEAMAKAEAFKQKQLAKAAERAAAAEAKKAERAKRQAEKDAEQKRLEEEAAQVERQKKAEEKRKREEELANKPYMKRAAARRAGGGQLPVEAAPKAPTSKKGKKIGEMSAAAAEAKRIEQERNARRAAAKEEKARREEEKRLHGDDKNWKIRRLVQDAMAEIDLQPLDDEYTSAHLEDRIVVCVRTRPFLPREEEAKDFEVMSFDGDDVVVLHNVKKNVDLSLRLENTPFNFDFGFHGSIPNDTVYSKTLAPMIESIFTDNKRISMFAFGQTGSGKTYTMMSMFEQAINDMFAAAGSDKQDLVLSVSYYEVYQGKVLDLFNGREEVDVLEDNEGNVNLRGLAESEVENPDNVFEMLEHGQSLRAQRATQMNDTSSRSHAIMQVIVRGADGEALGRLTLIDLAGSEKGSDTPDSTKETRGEAAEINKSLLALKECIRAMEHSGHTPFRGSKLTMIIRDSLIGAECRAIMIACVAPGYMSADATLNTLRYADRLKGGGANDDEAAEEIAEAKGSNTKYKENTRLNRLADPNTRSNRTGGSPRRGPSPTPSPKATPRATALPSTPRRPVPAGNKPAATVGKSGIPSSGIARAGGKGSGIAKPSGIARKTIEKSKPKPKAEPAPAPAAAAMEKVTAAMGAVSVQDQGASEDLVGFFVGLGIPDADAVTYSDALKADGFDDVDSLHDVTEEELTSDYAFKKGHLRKTLHKKKKKIWPR